MTAQTLRDLLPTASGRTIVVRSDLNCPLDEGTVTDDGRIRASLPVITQLAEAGAKVIVMAHLGRPNGTVTPEFSLAPVAKRMRELTDIPVTLADDITGPDAQQRAQQLEPDRFCYCKTSASMLAKRPRTTPSAPSLPRNRRLAGDHAAYVNDAFGAVHRKHASVYDIATILPSYQGTLVATELHVLNQLILEPKRPYTVVLGVQKVSGKRSH